MFQAKCGWCQNELRRGDELLSLDEKLFHIACATLYRLFCRELLKSENELRSKCNQNLAGLCSG
jgi:hypothetical protein